MWMSDEIGIDDGLGYMACIRLRRYVRQLKARECSRGKEGLLVYLLPPWKMLFYDPCDARQMGSGINS